MTLNDLKQRARDLTTTDATTYSDNELVRNLNLAYKKVVSWIIKSYDAWKFQAQQATTNLLANERSYLLPLDLLTIEGVEVNLEGKPNAYVVANPITLKEFQSMGIALENPNIDSFFTNASPRFLLERNQITIFPKPLVNVDNGLKIYYTDRARDLTNPDDSPIFSEDYHDILCWMAAIDYFFQTDNKSKLVVATQTVERLKPELIGYYQTREQTRPPVFRVRFPYFG